MMKFFVFALLAVASEAYVSISKPFASRSTTQLHESFGLGFAEDTYENQPDFLKGEAEYKEWVKVVSDDPFLGRNYNVIRRVRELDLLGKTAEQGILSKLEDAGLDLETIEELLPTLEQLGLLSFAANNQQTVLNRLIPLLVEPAPLLLPIVAGAIEAGPPAFFAAAAAAGGAELFLIANNVELPLVGLPAAPLAGLLLVPLAIAAGGAGAALGSLKK